MGSEDLPSRFVSMQFYFGSGRRTGVWLLLLLLYTSCATIAPIEETRLFSKAFTAVDGASQPLLDDHAVAERRRGQHNAITKAKANKYEGDCAGIRWAEVGVQAGFIEGFCLDDAPYFAEIGDPPATRAFRQGIRLLGDYAEVLLTLAEGRNLDETTAQVQTLGERISALASLTPGVGAAGSALTGALGALTPIIKDAAQAKNVEEVKRLVLAGTPHVKQLIERLQAAAPEVFTTLIRQSARDATGPEALNNPAVATEHLNRIAAYRIAVSNYVILLDELQQAFAQLVVAFQQPRNAVSLAAIAQRTAQLTAHAEAWRRVYSILRTGSE
jgi:hypothetical protein